MLKYRDYISWSQLSTWERDPNLYYEVYILGLDRVLTKAMELGKKVAEALETQDEKRDPMMNYLITFLPTLSSREHELNVVVDSIKLKGRFDAFDPKTLDLIEYKTGANYTQGMANKLGQIDFYCLMIWLKYHKMPKSIRLIWAKTVEDKYGGRKLTGDFKVFKVKKSLRDVIKIVGRIKKAKMGIDEMKKTLSI